MSKESGPTMGDKKESFSPDKSVLKEAYELLHADSPKELNRLYGEEDQCLMRSHAWDYKNPDLVVNKIKNTLESADDALLTEEEKGEKANILWFWYHHAISAAIWRYRDVDAAKMYAAKALEYQSEDHPNKITRLFDLLINGNVEEAEQWATEITDEVEAETAQSLLKEYKEEGFFGERKYTLNQLQDAILTSEQYQDHPFARQEAKRVFEFEAKNGPKELTYFGSYHTSDPADPVLEDITKAYQKANPEMVYVEGMESINERKDEWRERLKAMSLDEAKTEGENFYTLKLAIDAGADFESPEPSFASEVQHLIESGFSKKDIFAFYVYRDIAQYQRNHEKREPEECKRIVERESQRLTHRVGWDSTELASFGEEVLANLKLEDEQFYSDQVDPIPWKGKLQTTTNEISRGSSAFRDRHIFERIAEGLKKHDRLFAVYGSAHAVKQELPIKFLVEQGVS